MIASDNVDIYLYSNNQIRAINAASGLIEWENTQGGNLTGSPLISEDKLYLIFRNEYGNYKRNLYILRCLNKVNGITLWQTEIKLSDSDVPPKFYLRYFNERLIIFTSDGKLLAIDTVEHILKEQYSFDSKVITTPYFEDERIVFGTADKRIIAASIKNFGIYREFKLFDLPSVVFKKDNVLIWGDNKGNLTSATISPQTLSKKWQFRAGGSISTLTESENNILITSLDNYVYCLSIGSGRLIWKKRLSGRISTTPLISGNYAVLLSLFNATATIIDLRYGSTIGYLNLPSNVLLTGSPQVSNSTIIFPGAIGLYAFSTLENCLGDKITDKESEKKE